MVWLQSLEQLGVDRPLAPIVAIYAEMALLAAGAVYAYDAQLVEPDPIVGGPEPTPRPTVEVFDEMRERNLGKPERDTAIADDPIVETVELELEIFCLCGVITSELPEVEQWDIYHRINRALAKYERAAGQPAALYAARE